MTASQVTFHLRQVIVNRQEEEMASVSTGTWKICQKRTVPKE